MVQFLELRQAAVGAVNFLSAEDMARFGGSDIADLVKRIPGVNVVEGKFAVVRGLSDRYNSTEVNNLPMPSPDPLRQGLQLDLFPTSIIENVVTNKMFLPDMPGNSGGGAFDLATKSFSDEWFAKIKGGMRVNENAEDLFLRTPESSSRDLLIMGAQDERQGTFDRDDGVLSPFAGDAGSAPFNGSFAASFGDGFDYVENKRMRYLVSVSYDASSKTKKGGGFQNQYADNASVTGLQRNRTGVPELGIPGFRQGGPLFIAGYAPGFLPSGTESLVDANYPNNLNALFVPGSLAVDEPFLVPGTTYENYVQSETTVLGGLLFGLQADLDEDGANQITFTSLNSVSTKDSLTLFENGVAGGKDVDLPGGADDNPAERGFPVSKQIVTYEERILNSFLLNGSHVDDTDLHNIKFDWGIGYAKVNSDVPLRSESYYFLDDKGTADPGDDEYFIESSSFPGENPFVQESSQYIEQDTFSTRFDFDFVFDWLTTKDSILGVGLYSEKSQRTVEGTNAAYIGETVAEGVRGSSPGDLSQQLSELGISEFSLNGGPFETSAQVDKKTREGYLMGEIPIFEKFKISGGGRMVDLDMESVGTSALAGNEGTGSGQDGFTLQNLLDGSYNTLGGGTITNGDILGWTDANAPGIIDETWFLPALILQFDITDNLSARFGYSQTYALPSFREISPYFDYEGSTGDIILGNPFVRPSEVESFELRLDYTMDSGGFASVSIFKKIVEDPIERVKLKGLAGFEFTSYFNNKDEAILTGAEIEARHNLGFLSRVDDSLAFMEHVSFGFNVSLIDAVVDRPPEILGTYFTKQTNGPVGPFVGGDVPKERGLYDQPEWIANFDVTVDVPKTGTSVTLALYTQSDVLSAVGAGDAEGNQLSTLDEYTASYEQWDLSIKQQIRENFTLSFKISNLTDTERKVIYDPSLVEDFERYSYKLGRTYSLSATYEF